MPHGYHCSSHLESALELQFIYRLSNRSVVRPRLASWSRSVRRAAKKAPDDVLAAMMKVADMIDSHSEVVLVYWPAKVTNAFLEGTK